VRRSITSPTVRIVLHFLTLFTLNPLPEASDEIA
jgi:hypothetical protein